MEVLPHSQSYAIHGSPVRRLLGSLGISASRRGIPLYFWCTVFTALGGLLWGFDTGSIGPITVMPQFQEKFGVLSTWTQGLLVSSILIAAAIVSIVSGPLSDHISRTYTIALGGLVFAIGSTIAASSHKLAQFFVGRCISGIGEGLFISSITVYVTEISPARSRGRLATMVQLFNTLGTLIGYFVCYGTVQVEGGFSWRFPTAVPAVIAITMAILTPLFPHSPRWLLHVGKHEEAEVARERLGLKGQRSEFSRDSSNVTATRHLADGEPSSFQPVLIPKQRFWEQAQMLWAEDVRWKTVFCIFIMGIQQCSGIDAVLYYAPILFSQAGLSTTTATFLASGVSGIIMFVLTFASIWGQDRWSRRAQMIGGGAAVGGSMLLIGTLYATHANNTKSGQYAIIALIYIFVASFVSSWAIVCRIVCSEVQPTRTRAAAASLGQCANWFVNCIIAISTPAFLASSGSAPYFFFGGCSFLSVCVCLAFQPETKGLDLEIIDQGIADTPIQAVLRRRFAGLRNRMGRGHARQSSAEDGVTSSAVENVEMNVVKI